MPKLVFMSKYKFNLIFMKKGLILIISLLISYVIWNSCSNVDNAKSIDKNEIEENYFRYEGENRTMTLLLKSLKERNDTTSFISNIIKNHGNPKWNESVIIPTENRLLIFTPFEDDRTDECESIWIFKLTREQTAYRIVTKDEADSEDLWTFDYFTQEMLRKRPISGIFFKLPPEDKTRGWIRIERCVDVFVGAGEGDEYEEVYKGTHCWTETHFVHDNGRRKEREKIDFIAPPTLDEGGYGGGGGGVYQPEAPEDIEDSIKADKDILPKKKPKTIIQDCDTMLMNMKEDASSDYKIFSSHPGAIIGKNKFPSFQTYLDSIKHSRLEYSITFRRYIEYGDTTYSTSFMIKGTENNTRLETFPSSIAHIHNHPNGLPPSPLDMKSMVDIATFPYSYKSFYVIMPDKTLYEFRIDDIAKLRRFKNKHYERMEIDKNTNKFKYKTEFYNCWRNAEKKFKLLGETLAWEYAIAYIFKKYDMGISLLKKEKDSDKFSVKYLREGSDNRYELVICK